MATPQEGLEEAAAEVAEPLATQVAAFRADLAELGRPRGTDRQAARCRPQVGGDRTASGGYAKGEEAIDVVMAELQSLEDELAAATRRRPFASLGLATLVGFLLGVMFRR